MTELFENAIRNPPPVEICGNFKHSIYQNRDSVCVLSENLKENWSFNLLISRSENTLYFAPSNSLLTKNVSSMRKILSFFTSIPTTPDSDVCFRFCSMDQIIDTLNRFMLYLYNFNQN